MREKIEALMRRHGIGSFHYDDGVTSMALDLRPATAAGLAVTAPFAGRFRAAEGGPRGRVAQGDIIGFLSVGPLRRPVVAPAAGRLSAPQFAEDALVSYGTSLFTLYRDPLHPDV